VDASALGSALEKITSQTFSTTDHTDFHGSHGFKKLKTCSRVDESRSTLLHQISEL
jgi:hypothetical protein